MNKIITVLFLVLSTCLYAQDEIAKNILDKLSTVTKSYSNITIGFDFNFNNPNLNIKEKQSGFLIMENDSFLLEMEEHIVFNNGETQWIYLRDMNEVQIIKHNPEDEMMSPKNLFTIYEKGYKYTYVNEEVKNKKQLHTIYLFPKESNSFVKIELTINTTDYQIQRIILFDKDGGTYTYLITSFQTNNKTLKSFTFNPEEYPDIEIIDLM